MDKKKKIIAGAIFAALLICTGIYVKSALFDSRKIVIPGFNVDTPEVDEDEISEKSKLDKYNEEKEPQDPSSFSFNPFARVKEGQDKIQPELIVKDSAEGQNVDQELLALMKMQEEMERL